MPSDVVRSITTRVASTYTTKPRLGDSSPGVDGVGPAGRAGTPMGAAAATRPLRPAARAASGPAAGRAGARRGAAAATRPLRSAARVPSADAAGVDGLPAPWRGLILPPPGGGP